MRRPARFDRRLLILSTLGLSWLGLMLVHELGHVLFGLASGARVDRVVLHPLAFSRTDFGRNPHPRWAAWGGPLVGVLLPLLLWRIAVALRWRTCYLFRFFAGFCLIGNGCYLGAGALEHVGDAQDLLRAGASPVTLLSFGLFTVPLGLYLWHGLGKSFGLGEGAGPVDRKTALGAAALLLLIVLVEVLLGTSRSSP